MQLKQKLSLLSNCFLKHVEALQHAGQFKDNEDESAQTQPT